MLEGVKVSANELLALLVATSFAAGLNLYATVATLGLLARGGLLPLPATLQLLASWYVIAISGVLFLIEFFADKIPATCVACAVSWRRARVGKIDYAWFDAPVGA